MHMTIDETGRHDQTGKIVRRYCLGERARRMHARDHGADDADVGLADLHGRDIGNACAAQQQVERRPALRGVDRALADLEWNRIEQGYSALMPVAFTSAENFSFSAARNAANSFGELPDGSVLDARSFSSTAGSLTTAASA